MGKSLQVLGSLGLVILFTGCQTMPYQGVARDIKRKPSVEGVVAIPLNFRDEDRSKAEQKMASNCGAGQYKVLEEGEVAIGQKTDSSGKETDRKSTQTQVGSLFGIPLTSGDAGGKNSESSQTTTQIKEWQIAYKCLASTSSGSNKKTVR